jgi:hypothetical protein
MASASLANGVVEVQPTRQGTLHNAPDRSRTTLRPPPKRENAPVASGTRPCPQAPKATLADGFAVRADGGPVEVKRAASFST